MTVEVHLAKKEMIKEDLSAIEAATEDHHQDLKDEMTVEVHLAKKVGHQKKLMGLKKNLLEIKKSPLQNFQRNSKDLDYRYN